MLDQLKLANNSINEDDLKDSTTRNRVERFQSISSHQRWTMFMSRLLLIDHSADQSCCFIATSTMVRKDCVFHGMELLLVQKCIPPSKGCHYCPVLGVPTGMDDHISSIKWLLRSFQGISCLPIELMKFLDGSCIF